MPPPNARERKALEALQFQEWEWKAQLYVGEKTFASLSEKGWIAQFQGHNPDGDKISITDLGRAALAMPKPMAVRKPTRLKEAPARLTSPPNRLSGR